MVSDMKAFVCEKSGEKGRASLLDIPTPSNLEQNEVLIQVDSASVNFPDPLQIKGAYQDKPEEPFVLGMEFSGIIADVFDKRGKFQVGDRVVGMGQGAFAEYIKVDRDLVYKIPENLSLSSAALLPLAAGTAYYGLLHRGTLKSGEIVAVAGASGGTGLAAVQIAKSVGARVIAIVSSETKASAAIQSGADYTVNYHDSDVRQRILEITDGYGIDVFYDTVGGEIFESVHRTVAWGGRILTVGFASGKIPRAATNHALLKGYSIVGVNWSRARSKTPELCQDIISNLADLVFSGGYTPVIDSQVSLQDVGKAIAKLADQIVIGKVLVNINE